MAVLVIQGVSKEGLGPVYAAAAAGGDTAHNDGNIMLHAKNTNAATRTVRITAQRACNFGEVHTVDVVVPATTGDRMIGPFDVAIFGETLQITYPSGATNLSIAAIRVP